MSKPKLALIPSGYKSGKVYSILPNDATGDFDFERQSIGTRVRKDGLIEEAKTVGSITNLQIRSEEFNNSVWTKSNSTVTADDILAPNGTNTADKLVENTANAIHKVSSVIFSIPNNTYTFSVYAKKNGRSNFHLSLSDSATGQANILVDLDNGTFTNGEKTTGSWTNVSGGIEELANGWYRVHVTGDKNSGTNVISDIELYNSGRTYTGNGTSGIYIWGAMVSEGALSDYIKTEGTTETKRVETFTDVPRLDWLNSSCPSLLLEPQRSNIQLRSEEFDNAVWSKVNASITANQIVAPNGEYTADKLTATASSLSTYVYEQHSLSTSTDYSMSVFVKKGTSNLVRLDLEDFTSGTQGRMTFNLNTKEITQTVGTASYEDYGNGWYRLKVSFTTSATLGVHYLRIWDYETVNGAYFYLWGAQMEQGSYPTSYIKTEASTVTRLKDECLNGGDSDLFDITEGTFFIDANNFGTPLNSYNMITLSDGGNNLIRFIYESSRIRTTVYNGATQQDYFITGTSDNQRNKVAITFKENEFKTYFNGILKDTDTSGVVPTNFNRLNFAGSSGTSRHFEGKVYDTRVYDRVLTEAEAIELTTL